MKINRDKLSKFFARFGLIFMSFVIMIPMLCSMAFPVTITITNPNNAPYEHDYFELNGNYTPPTPTESITNVWTGIMNWITSSLNTVQGLFITNTGDNTISPGTYTFDSIFTTNFPEINISDPSLYTLNFTYNGVPYDYIGVGSFEVTLGGSITSSNQIAVGNEGDDGLTVYSVVVTDGVVDEEYNGYLVDTPFQIVVDESQSISPLMRQILSDYTDYDSVNVPSGSSYQLTLLGTLAVIGLSIALGFFIIGVIQRFLKLRG